MDPTPFLIASRVLVVAVCAASVVALAVNIARVLRGTDRPRRELIPLLTLATMLVVVAISAIWLALPFARLTFALYPLLFATYPNGRFVPRWTAALAVLWIPLAIVVIATGDALTSQPWWFAIPGATALLLIGAQLYRYVRRSTTREREATRWAILGVGSSMLLFLVLRFFGEIGTPGTAAEAWAHIAVTPFIAGPVIGLVLPRVWNVDAAFRVFLGGVIAALPLAVVYAGAAFAAGTLGASPAASGWWGASFVAACAYPVVRHSMRAATAIVYRGRADADTAVSRLGERLHDVPDPRVVSETVVQAVADAVRADDVELRGDGVLSARMRHDSATDGAASVAEEFPISFHGEVLATLVVHPLTGEPALTPYDRALVERLALHSAPALHGARALAELTATHARLLLAREEERRRLRRDLHDDLSPTLSGLSLSAAALARRAESVDPDLAATARDLANDIQDAVEQTREIAYGLRPPILDDRGLVAAIRDRLHGPATDLVHVDIVAPEEPLELPAAVDLAALRIVQEAVANVRRHADATHCTVLIERVPGELRLRIDDDGRGIPPHIRPGIGLTSIRDRARELGGTTAIGRSAEGGGSVSVRLPFDEAPRRAAIAV